MSSEPTEGYPYGLVQAVCDVLGQTHDPGLSGAEIDKMLRSIGAAARDRNVNKRTGLFDALYAAQRTDGRIFIQFITRAVRGLACRQPTGVITRPTPVAHARVAHHDS